MAQRVLSILLGSEIVKVCEVALAGKKKVQIFNAIDLVIPEGLCDDGVIFDVDGLAQSILQGLEGEGFKAKKIVFTLATKRIASKEAIIPYCKESRIKQIVDINAAEYFPVANIEDYVINYSILEVLNNDAVKNYRLSVIATPKDIVDRYYELAKAMGMSVAAIDYAGNASLQLLKLQTPGNEVDAILQMGTESTIVNIMDGPTMVMQRSVPYGRAALVEAVKEYRLVPDSVADSILIEEDISYLANSSVEVADAVRALFSSINRIIEFYTSRNQDKPIQHIYMIGDVVSVNGLVDLFNNEWDHEVEQIDFIHGIDIKNKKNLNNEIAANYIVNMGAVIAPINIEYIEEKAKRKSSGLPWWLLVFSIIVSGVMIGGVLYVYNSAKEANEEMQSQIDSFGDLVCYEGQYNRSVQQLETMNTWYDSTKSANESLVKFVDDLEENQPSDVAITQFSATAGEITINGYGSSKSSVAEYVIQLKKLSYVYDVKMDYITESIADSGLRDTFSLSLKLDYDDPYATNEGEEETVESDIDDDYGYEGYIEDETVEDEMADDVVMKENEGGIE